MKTLITLIGLSTLLAIYPSAHAQTFTNSADAAQSISNVLLERLSARFDSMYIVINDGRLKSAIFHPARYVKLLKQIDTAGCPQDFRLAWLNYVQTWERRNSPQTASENLLNLIPAATGNLSGLNDIAKRSEANDTLIPWQKCEQVALEYGVDTSKVKLH